MRRKSFSLVLRCTFLSVYVRGRTLESGPPLYERMVHVDLYCTTGSKYVAWVLYSSAVRTSKVRPTVLYAYNTRSYEYLPYFASTESTVVDSRRTVVVLFYT